MVQRVQSVPGVLDHVRPGLPVHDTQLHIQGFAVEDARAYIPGTSEAHALENLAAVYQGRRLHQADTQRVVFNQI